MEALSQIKNRILSLIPKKGLLMSFQGWCLNSANSFANEYAVKFLSYLIKLLTQSSSSADAAAVFHGAAFGACPTSAAHSAVGISAGSGDLGSH